jgi:hypothetical protein
VGVHRRIAEGDGAALCQDPLDPDRTIGANSTDHGVTLDLLIRTAATRSQPPIKNEARRQPSM